MEPTRLGKYDVVAKIGQGAMGEVYRAHDSVLGRDVAIKTMAGASDTDDELRRRFLREAQSAARLNHPNIITIHDFGEEQGRMYIAMELLEGSDLKEVIARGSLSLDDKLALMDQICDGLAFAHAREVIHRDLKPANIHILPSGQVKIMDFGLARMASSQMTRQGMILGTPFYMSPEQVRGQKSTTRSDVFALGSLFYELLTGKKAFDASGLTGVLHLVMNEEPAPLETLAPDLPPAVCAVVRKALAKDAAQRYPDARDMREALRAAGLRSQRPAPSPLPAPPRSDPTLERKRATAEAATIATPGLKEPARSTIVSGAAATLPAASATPPPPTLIPPTVAPPPPRPAPPRTPPAAAAPEATRPALPGEVPAPASWRRFALPLALGLVVTIVVVTWLAMREQGPTPSPSPSPTEAAALPSIEAARASLDDKDYRRAAELAEQILRADPQDAAALDVAQRARGGQRSVEEAVARVRVGLESGNTEEAADALARLLALDPRNPEAPDFAGKLNQVFKGRAEEAQRSMQRARADAERARVAGSSEFARAASLGNAGEMAFRGGEYASAARQFLEARDAFERARRAVPLESPGPPRPPTPSPAISLPTPSPATPAPPTPTPATPILPTPAPPTPAPRSEVAEVRQIRGVLDEYRAAFEKRDADALRAVQPGVDYGAMKQVFATVTGYTVRVEVKEVVVKGDTAVARCVVTYNPVPKPAGKIQPVSTVFHLRRSGELWLIDRLERK